MPWVELRYGVRRTHAPHLVPEEQVGTTAHSFRSVYGFGDATASRILREGTAAVGGESPVLYTDVLRIDIDRSIGDVTRFRDHLRRVGAAYRLFDTGRRGGHFEIPTGPREGTALHTADALWVRQHVADGAADLSIYKPTGQWRLVGAVHEKSPGKIKRLVELAEGSLTVVPPAPAVEPTPEQPAPEDISLQARADWLANLTAVREAGGRTPHLYILVCHAVELGLPYDETLAQCIWWNSRFASPPHPEHYIRSKVSATYNQVRYRRNNGNRNRLPNSEARHE